ncbi:hypothetical protein BJ508DRAFT_7540 [Ascobolus immersus RN42]|uniref:Uncharacterized protein n=1 Tax=Ascobolus immersus RN42 TaxID=1160509 RepID=A0A3N4IMD5_ASCIM|nr:hypothetical protein BJ508DRAFT_7540 [Ascobolus immersus RN42]
MSVHIPNNKTTSTKKAFIRSLVGHYSQLRRLVIAPRQIHLFARPFRLMMRAELRSRINCADIVGCQWIIFFGLFRFFVFGTRDGLVGAVLENLWDGEGENGRRQTNLREMSAEVDSRCAGPRHYFEAASRSEEEAGSGE